MIHQFKIPAKPVGKERPRVTRKATYTPAKTKDFETLAAVVMRNAWAGRDPLDGPLRVSVVAVYQRPKKKPGYSDVLCYTTGGSDVDNIFKAVTDPMQVKTPKGSALRRSGVISNDSKIVNCRIAKIHGWVGEDPYVLVSVELLKNWEADGWIYEMVDAAGATCES